MPVSYDIDAKTVEPFTWIPRKFLTQIIFVYVDLSKFF